ncbi:hypothetical protein GCM10008942_23120 [Rhizomicrobium electricum]|uniref:Uncharacterized protein n=1 Tax=Rhizomicrobium electricum TaxID=480070 RepID=A0ABP3PW01_9PROT
MHGLRVGAAKVDVSRQAGRGPDGVRGILDHSFVREIVLGNDKISGALITVATIGSATKPGPITAPEPTPAPM